MSTVEPVLEQPDSATSLDETASALDSASTTDPQTNGDQKEEKEKPEDALEEGEILELQAFIPRKEWIEQKIQFLEQLPPVDLFNNLEYLVYTTPTPIPGLPTREQLDEWMKQHDAIEHEAEQFDANDMKRLKKFAKAATQRNLSPADTDLIEVTLTTLLGLDRLIHLLRSRSDMLELTGLRLTWEEKRLGAWGERDAIRRDLEHFVTKSARWTPDVYRPVLNHGVNSSSSSINVTHDSPSPSPISAVSPRRNSVFASSSKGMRPKIAEDLTREAGRYTTRIAAWKRNFIAPAGKALDNMIEKKEVPDAVLDEQDRLEDNARPLEALSRFAMEVVGQWKKSDELYGELKKEQTSAASLHDDVAAALKHHPSAANDSTFITRSQALQQRISNLTTLVNPRLFPKPTHPSFPDQPSYNESILSSLTQELQQTKKIIEDASAIAQGYHRRTGLVSQVDGLRLHLEKEAARLDECTRRLIEGAEAEDGDGSPLCLDSVECLDSLKHGAYLAVLPIISSELDDAENSGNKHALQARDVMRSLKDATVDSGFSAGVDHALEQFEKAKKRSKAARDDATTKAAQLRDVRKVWHSIGGTWKQLDVVKADLADRMERSKWVPIGQEKPVRSPMVQETSSWPDPSSSVASQLDKLASGISSNITTPLEVLKSTIGPDVTHALTSGADIVKQYVENMKGMVRLYGVVTQQATAMSEIRREEMILEDQIDSIIARFDSTRQLLSSGTVINLDGPSLISQEIESLEEEHSLLAEEIPQFVAGLSARIPFIGKPDLYFHGPLRSSQPSFSTFLQSKGTDVLSTAAPFVLPLDAVSLDHNVRSDANNLSILISTKAQALSRHRDFLQLALSARRVSNSGQSLREQLLTLSRRIQSQKDAASGNLHVGSDDMPAHQSLVVELEGCLREIDNIAADSKSLTVQLVPQFRNTLRELLARPGAQEAQMQGSFITPCTQQEKAIENALEQVSLELEATTQLVTDALRKEREAVERIRLLQEEETKRIEAERLQKEEEERVRLAEEERRRQEEEDQRRKEEEEALRKKQEEEERERLAMEEAERLRHQEEASRRAAEDEAARQAEQRRLEAERQELQKQREADRLRAEAEARAREEEEARKKAEEEEAKARRQAEEEARLLAIQQEEERLKALARQLEEEQRRLKEEQELSRQREEEERKLKEEQEEARRREEEERRALEEKERQQRIEQEEEERRRRIEEEEKERLRRIEAEEQERLRRIHEEEQERLRRIEEEEAMRQENERRRLEEQENITHTPIVDDVFAIPPAPSPEKNAAANGTVESLKAFIDDLRHRLRSLSLEQWANPPAHSSHSESLPNSLYITHIQSAYAEIKSMVSDLPVHYEDPDLEAAFQSLVSELDTSQAHLERCQDLARISGKVSDCDASLSDLLEHVDRYPLAPTTDLQSSHRSDPTKTPEEQLNARVIFTSGLLRELRELVQTMSSASDPRVVSERERLDQTWDELQDMCTDRMTNKSRPSTASGQNHLSGRTSSLSATSSLSGSSVPSLKSSSGKGRTQKTPFLTSKRPPVTQKTPTAKKTRGNIGLGPSPRPSMLSPDQIINSGTGRNASVAVTNKEGKDKNGRDSRLNKRRSVSGPLVPNPNSTLYKSTYSSRQRTASIVEPPATPTRTSLSLARSPFKTPKALRPPSPTISEVSSNSSKPKSASGYSRATQNSLNTPRPPVPKRTVRKPYVPNPRNKLDVAVGEVINKMAVSVPIQAVSSSGWEDKSGKYWIGDDEDVKLCFCRILRSQTVMVRVGGGWCELSKFLKDHFAHLLEEIPEAPSLGSKEQKWISSSTLGSESVPAVPNTLGLGAPRTPEPKGTSPTVLLHSPSGASPRSVHSTSSPASSPLAPLHFIRKAEESPIRSTTPLPHRLPKNTNSRTPARVVSGTTPAKGPHWRH